MSALSLKNLVGKNHLQFTKIIRNESGIIKHDSIRIQSETSDVHANLKKLCNVCTKQFDLRAELNNLANLFRKQLSQPDSQLCVKLVKVLGHEDVIQKLRYHNLILTILRAFRTILEAEQADDEEHIVWEKLTLDQNTINNLKIVKLKTFLNQFQSSDGSQTFFGY